MTQQQKKNLAILTLYCHTLPPGYDGFDMLYYVQNGGKDGFGDPVRKPEKMGCGTSACFVGHGPHAGVEPVDGEYWGRYADRAFGATCSGNTFAWLFHELWPNSIELALKRAAWLLEGYDIPQVDAGEEYDDEKEETIEVLQWNEPDGFSTFTPDWDKITQIANS
jgi:hypothetical protein